MTLTVGRVMTREVKTLAEGQVLLDAMKFMREHHVRHIPILNADGDLVGVLTDRDIKRASPSALAPGQREVWEKIVTETPLSRVMTREPTTGSSDMNIRTALRLFVDESIGCLPVLDEGKLIGIVTAQNLFGAMLEILDE